MPAGKDDIVAREQARAWIDAARGKWRLQILAKRVRIQRDGTRKEIPTRLRRFVEGLPWAFVKPALDYLLELAPYEGVVANGVDFGVPYRPTLTVWQRDAQSAATGAVRPDATYTLVQDLVEADADDVYGFATSSSCSESVETDYVWDAAEVGELPQGTQGVTYGLAAVNRKEDGTFDYQLVKRVALTQHVEETVVRDDALSRVTQELWDNVYTDGEGNYVDHTGAPIDVPAAGLYDGVSVRVEGLSENQDCTLKFQVVRESAKEADAGMSCRDTAFEHEHGSTTAGNASAPGHVPPAGGGTFYKVESRLQQDGSYLTTEERTDEHEQESGKDYRRTTRALITTTTTRNTPQQAAEPSAPGERQSHEMTPGGLYNLTVVTATPSPSPDSARCAKTVFEEVHDSVSMRDSIDPDAHGEAGGGRHSEVVQDMDEYGVVKRVDRVTTEQSQPGSVTEVRKTIDGAIKTTTNRNMSARAPDPSEVGGSVRNELTPGGSWNQTVTEAFPSPAGLIAEQCERTGLVHTHMELSTDLVKALVGDVAACPGRESGTQTPIYARESRMTDVGSWRNTLTVRTPIPRIYTFDWTDTTKTLRRIVTYENHLIVFRNYVAVPEEVKRWESVSLSVSINEFNLLDGTAHCRKWIDEAEAGSGSSADGGMAYSGMKTVEDRDGNLWDVTFDIYRNDSRSLSSGFLANGSKAHDYPALGLHSEDNGKFGIKYTGKSVSKKG